MDSILQSISGLPDSQQVKQLKNYCWDYRFSDPEMSINFGLEAVKTSKRTNNYHLLAESLNLIGVIQRYLGKYSAALSYHEQALVVAQNSNDQLQIAFSINNAGVIYQRRGKYNKALEFQLRALRIFESIKNDDGIAFCALDLGNTFVGQKNYPLALEYYNRSLQIRKKDKNPIGTVRALYKIAWVHYEKAEYNEALSEYLFIENSYLQSMNRRDLGDMMNGIAKIYSIQKDYNKAIEYRLKALSFFKDLKFPEELVQVTSELGVLYSLKKDFLRGRDYINQAVAYADKTESAKIKSQLFYSRAMFFENLGKKDSAVICYKSYIQMEDSITASENFSKFAEIEAEYENEKITKENLLLAKDVELHKRQAYFLVALVLFGLLLIGFIYRRSVTLRALNKELRDLHIMKDAFIKIIAHDLRSPFNTIINTLDILKNDFDDLPKKDRERYISNVYATSKQTYQLLDNLLLWSRANSGKLQFNPEEFVIAQCVKDTIVLYKTTAVNKNITLGFSCDETLSVLADKQMIQTVLRNLITNGIKFTDNGGRIHVEVLRSTAGFSITVQDTGVGMTPGQIENLFRIDTSSTSTGTRGEKGTGFGLLLCKEFVDMHKGKITVESKKDMGSKFILFFPQELKK